MMNAKWLIGCLIGTSILLQAAPKVPPQPSKQEIPAYDADLFRKDVEVFSLHAGFLYWRVQEGSVDYALKMNNPAPTSSYAQGKFQTATFDGAPGFRIAAGFFRAPKYWEVWGQYTRLVASGTNHSTKPEASDQFLTGTWPQRISSSLSGARSNIHMNYNVADLLVDRFFNPNPHLRLRLQGGATVAYISQSWKIRYSNDINESTNIHNQWKFVGGGFRIGTMVDWFWGYDIYITALGSVGTLLGSYHNSAKQTATTDALAIRNARFSDIRPAFTAQAIFGPSWQKNFTHTRLEIFAGYELNTWFNLQEVYRSTAALPENAKETWINTSLIALQGLTTRLSLDF